MNPVSTYRKLRDIAGRRPYLVGGLGLCLIGEGVRVGLALGAGTDVRVYGRSGATVWSTAEDGPWVAAYVAWVGGFGLLIVATAFAAWRRRRAATVERSGGPAPADAAGGAILWRRRRGWFSR